MNASFDVIIVGTGFASAFFLSRYLDKSSADKRILVLERGNHDTHEWQVESRRNSSADPDSTFTSDNPKKRWMYTPALGGGSNCWYAVTPRLMPNDFRMQSQYGVGLDWPLQYDELEDHYQRAEEIMSVSGPHDGSPFPRSRPYPQPPHRFSDPDRILKAAFPDQFFQAPAARTRTATENRPRCCAMGVCNLCPIGAKFTVQNEMSHVYRDSRVRLELAATALAVETTGPVATGVRYERDGAEILAHAEIVVLGANAIFNPNILQRSDLDHPLLGTHLDEQVSLSVTIDLDGVDNFQGSTSITGHGYMMYDGEHRKEHAGCLIESWNVPIVRPEQGKWRQRLRLKFIYENLSSPENRIDFRPDDPGRPRVIYRSHSDYALDAIKRLPSMLERVLAPLPVENLAIDEELGATEAHILGTVRMGQDPRTSVVDRHLIHHTIRNLLVLGGSAFPTISPANPTLTISALSLWAADHLLS